MAFRTAIATSDGIVVNQHFGHTEKFFIYEVDGELKFRFIEERKVKPPCSFGEHDEDTLAEAVDRISDCKYVLCFKIGKGANDLLQDKGIKAYQMGDYIESSLHKLWNIVNANKDKT